MPCSNNKCARSICALNIAKLSLVISVAIFSLGNSEGNAAGFRELPTNGVDFGIQYPSDTPSKTQRFGPFEATMAEGAPVRRGQHEIVLFSHGNGGRYRNHYLTTQALADAGYIVIAPRHRADYLVGGRKTAASLDHRYFELESSLLAIQSDPDFQPTYCSRSRARGQIFSWGVYNDACSRSWFQFQ